MEIVDNRKEKAVVIDFGDLVITKDGRKYVAVDISLQNEKNFLGFIGTDDWYLCSHSFSNYVPTEINGSKIIDVVKSKEMTLTLGE